MKTIAWTILGLLASTPAFADQIKLKSGGVLVGLAREEGDRVLVELPTGVIGFDKADVEEIIRSRTVMHDYRDFLAGAEKANTAPAFFTFR